MNNEKKRESLSDKIKVALDAAIKDVIAETKAKNSYLVYSDKYNKNSCQRSIRAGRL